MRRLRMTKRKMKSRGGEQGGRRRMLRRTKRERVQDKLYILLDAAGHWKELRLQVPRSKPLRFDGVWGACEQDGKRENKRTRVVRVAEFLQNAGVPSRKPLQRISGWTSGSMKLGLKKGVHFWTQQWAQGRGQHPWVASKATLRKVWPHLRE